MSIILKELPPAPLFLERRYAHIHRSRAEDARMKQGTLSGGGFASGLPYVH